MGEKNSGAERKFKRPFGATTPTAPPQHPPPAATPGPRRLRRTQRAAAEALESSRHIQRRSSHGYWLGYCPYPPRWHEEACTHASVVVSWLLGWAILLCAVPGSAAEHYVISPQKSQFQFKAYAVLAKPLGTFHSFSGDIIADAQQLGASSVRFVIDAASIDTANARRDKHLRSEDFLFVEKYPKITFRSTAITKDGTGYLVQGELELHGVTKSLTIPVTLEQRQDEMVVQGSVALNRRDFGVQYNSVLNPVQDRVDVLFTIVGVKS